MSSARRLAGLRALLESPRAAFLTFDPVNIGYLTDTHTVFGDDASAHAMLVTEKHAVVLTDSRYSTAASHAARSAPWSVRTIADDLLKGVAEAAAEAGADSITFESTLPFALHRRLHELTPVTLFCATEQVESLRAAKEPEEITCIESAQALADRAFSHLLERVNVGVTERELALELEFFLRKEGSQGVAFPPIVASGPNSALPHAQVTDRALQRGDFLKLDFGARVDGYCSDMTRTVVAGAANSLQREVYSVVAAANAAGIAAVQAGKQGRQIDAAARSVVETAGYGEKFRHGVGHGVGREVHELPGVGPRSANQVTEGCVITIEPGIYLEGLGGVRIEDLVVVEPYGARVLSNSTKELLEL